MKKTPNSAVTFAFVTCAMLVTSCANDVETDVNIDPVGNAISFSPSVGHTTRATETKIGNLGNFAVVARGMHHDGVLYDNFLIGSDNGGDIATREGTSSIWKLNHNVYWPSTFDNVMFFAYTTLKTGETGDVLYGDATFGFENKNPYIQGYTPKKADLTVESTSEDAVWADGKVQEDLLVAYTKQARTTSPTTVSLNFKHVLTQISIKARQKNKTDQDHRIVKIKGAWIVNAAQSGKLLGNLHYAPEHQTTDDTQEWTASSEKVAYGSFYNQILTLDADTDIDLLRPEGNTSPEGETLPGSLMLVPEDLTEWNNTTNSNGAYIMLLCRVELKHSGATHTTTGDTNVDMSDIYTDGTNHYHQLFPVNTEKYDAAEYGFVCVPLSSKWKTNGIGKHYTYYLDICGEKTGAGLYPPIFALATEEEKKAEIKKLIPPSKIDSEEVKVITTLPSGKNVGDNVLDEPIKFSVTVEEWATPGADDWKPGDVGF